MNIPRTDRPVAHRVLWKGKVLFGINSTVTPFSYKRRVIRTRKPLKKTVELAPSRIRRQPVREEAKVEPLSREWEIGLGIAGISLFAVIITMLTIGFSVVTGRDFSAGAAPVHMVRFASCAGGSSPDCVVDGNTIYLGRQKVEIGGMEVPRIQGAACDQERSRGVDAAVRLADLLNGGKVTLAGKVRGPDGQMRSKVDVNGDDVALAMIGADVAHQPSSEPQNWCAADGQ